MCCGIVGCDICVVCGDICVVLRLGRRAEGTLLALSKDESVHPTTQKRNGQENAEPPHLFIQMFLCHNFNNCNKYHIHGIVVIPTESIYIYIWIYMI